MKETSASLIVHANERQLEWAGIFYECAIGRGGISENKQEGDGCTPIGSFQLREVLYRADRIPALNTHLPQKKIERDDGWCDDCSSEKYNQLVKIYEPCSKEHLWREDSLYDVLMVIGYNDHPPIPCNGSAIFIHSTTNYSPTDGCIAVSKKDLLVLLQEIDKNTKIVIQF